MKKRIAVVAGDGIGPEIVETAVGVIGAVGKRFGHSFELDRRLAGGCAYEAFGRCLPDGTLAACKAADAAFFFIWFKIFKQLLHLP